MLKLTATLIAAIFVVLSVWGRPDGSDVEVTRALSVDDRLLGAGASQAEAAPARQPQQAAELRDISRREGGADGAGRRRGARRDRGAGRDRGTEAKPQLAEAEPMARLPGPSPRRPRTRRRRCGT